MHNLRSGFSYLARQTARAAGHPLALFISVTFVIVWALCGPQFDYTVTRGSWSSTRRQRSSRFSWCF
ncbi:MAG: low affinity iron permease family protein [Burkholderiales bacterium]